MACLVGLMEVSWKESSVLLSFLKGLFDVKSVRSCILPIMLGHYDARTIVFVLILPSLCLLHICSNLFSEV